MPEPLIATEERLGTHFRAIEQIIESVVAPTARIRIAVEWQTIPVVASLIGDGCERVPRNRGMPVLVAPFVQLQRGLWAWLSYREEWDAERRNKNTRRFSFRSANLTVHFGLRNDRFKPQMFRAEWAGWARWNNLDEYGFSSADAGHPHWQFDALDSLNDDDVAVRAEALRELLSERLREPVIHEFAPQLATEEVKDVVSIQKLSRIHFASAAAWWENSPRGSHTHSPNSARNIQMWVGTSLRYLSTELKRLQVA